GEKKREECQKHGGWKKAFHMAGDSSNRCGFGKQGFYVDLDDAGAGAFNGRTAASFLPRMPRMNTGI
ncbi:MAG: hypothetical protein ACI8QF_004113, partial [Limisphaerales bacterium]